MAEKFDEELSKKWNSASDDERINLIEEHGVNKLSLLKWHPENADRGYDVCAYCVIASHKREFCDKCDINETICTDIHVDWVVRTDSGEDATAEADAVYDALLKHGEE